MRKNKTMRKNMRPLSSGKTSSRESFSSLVLTKNLPRFPLDRRVVHISWARIISNSTNREEEGKIPGPLSLVSFRDLHDPEGPMCLTFLCHGAVNRYVLSIVIILSIERPEN